MYHFNFNVAVLTLFTNGVKLTLVFVACKKAFAPFLAITVIINAFITAQF